MVYQSFLIKFINMPIICRSLTLFQIIIEQYWNICQNVKIFISQVSVSMVTNIKGLRSQFIAL
jgi:hypothetical protein